MAVCILLLVKFPSDALQTLTPNVAFIVRANAIFAKVGQSASEKVDSLKTFTGLAKKVFVTRSRDDVMRCLVM